MFFVYVLRSIQDDKFYTGQTKDLDRRLIEHNVGRSNFTRNRGPYVVVHVETFNSRAEAMHREQFLKSGKGREELKRIILGL